MSQRYVQRTEYLNFLKRHKDKHIIKVVSGVRRSGKSILFLLFREYLQSQGIEAKQITAINFEDMNYDRLRNPQELYHYLENKLIPDKMNYIFLDEVQHVKEFERVVDSLFIKENVDLYITGSNAYFLSGEISTLLTGRYVQLNMLPLSFSEFVQWHKQNGYDIDLQSLFDKYLKSAFPYTLFTKTERERQEYLRGIYSTIVLNDIVARLNVSDVPVLEKLIQTLFSSVGSPINVNRIVNTLKSNGFRVSHQTVDKYLHGITESLLMYEARSYDVHGRGLLNSNGKYYVVDVGLRRLLLPDHQEDFGHIIENVVYLELRRRYPNVYVGKSKKYEVDFVALNEENQARYFQVALTTLDEHVLKRELHSLQIINDSYPKYLLTLDTINKNANYDGIQKLNIIDWLMNER